MKLVNFSVTNYRSITSAHKIALQNTTVLIGKNNEGKSNILKSLQLVMSILQEHASEGLRASRFRENLYEWKRDFPIQLQLGKGVKQTIFKLEFLLDEDEIAEFKKDIGANLNGSLPLEVRIGKENLATIKLIKRGKGTKSLSVKSAKIARFIASRIYFNYIPAVRTDEEAIKLIGNMLSQELRSLEKEVAYQEALDTIKRLQEPILNNLALRVQTPLKEFIPSIKSVKIEIFDSVRRTALRSEFNVVIDDGTPTNIEYKGDGIKSLAALGLLKSQSFKGRASILAIEEPESHLHPSAIHQVNEIIRSISQDSQVIISTHNPLFVDRDILKANVIVSDGKATPAKNISSIRDLLGIKASDNLTHASYALVVEGEEDQICMKAILPTLSEKIGKAIKNNLLIIEPIGGAGNLTYKLSLLKNSLCVTHTLLDDDNAGKTGYEKAEKDSLISISSCTFTKCEGFTEAEFEDCLSLDVYKNIVFEEFGVDLSSSKFRGSEKWSDRLRKVFLDQGKPWNDSVLIRVKYKVAHAVSSNPKNSLHDNKRNSIDALIVALEKMIKTN